MYSENNSVHHLLWCILVALKTAEREKPFPSETDKRHFIIAWLDTANNIPSFQEMISELASLRKMLENCDRNVSIDGTLRVLLNHAFSAERCDLFRFRSSLNTLTQRGWSLVVCHYPENITTELFNRRKGHRKHILQLTRTEDAFQSKGSIGDMIKAITFHLLIDESQDINEDAETIFNAGGFQVVVQDSQLQLNSYRIVRTIHIGTNSIPKNEWNPHKDSIWAPPRKENYH